MSQSAHTFSKLKWLLLCTVLGLSANTQGATIANGYEWYQPIDLINHTWADFRAACPTGACSGQLAGTGPDLSGWTMATVDDVNALFNSYIFAATGTNPMGPGPSDYFSGPLGWASSILYDFQPTWGAGDPFAIPEIAGWLFDPAPASSTSGFIGRVSEYFTLGHIESSAGAHTNSYFSTDYASETNGAWLYRSAVSVPAPTTLALTLMAILGVQINRRRHKTAV